MALANLGRNKKRTILVIVSMTLSLVLFNTVFTLSSGFDIDKYVSKFLNKDFIISSADYFQYRFDRSDAELSQTFIQAIQQEDAYEDGGELSTVRVLEEFFSVESETIVNHNKDKAGNPHVSLYGADDFLLKSMEVIEGKLIGKLCALENMYFMVCKVMITGTLSKINRYKSVMSCVSIIRRQMDSIVQWMLRLI